MATELGCSTFVVGDDVCCNLGVDRTYGPCGAFAEYAVVPEKIVAKRSASAEQAAAVVT